MSGIIGRSAVAEPDIQVTIGAKRQVATVVIRERLRDDWSPPDAKVKP
jgi:hypothetical protein